MIQWGRGGAVSLPLCDFPEAIPDMPGPEHNIKVFISYRNIETSRARAEALALRLRDNGYDVFFDAQELRGGDIWEHKIYNNIRDSDVLLVLIEADTAASEWVQREVDVARGALVSILPLQIAAEVVDIFESQRKLALENTQFIPFTGADAEYEMLIDSIERLSKQTRDHQRIWQRDLTIRRRAERAPNQKSAASFTVSGGAHPCQITLSTGDVSRLKGIDVLVNSENDYMQMARTFGKASLSATLRREGALIRRGRLIEDTVQDQLNEQISQSPDFFGLPVGLCQVIATHAGHPESKLVKQNRARYIFHAATMRVNSLAVYEYLVPIETDDGIKETVHNCLNMVLEIDAACGVISPQGTARRAQEEVEADSYQPIRSIGFPLFGTGQGGRAVIDVVPPMLAAFAEFLHDHAGNDELALENIYLCAYSKIDARIVEHVMSRQFVRAIVRSRAGR